MKTATDPHDLLAALIESHLAFALGDRSVLAVYAQEQHNLPDADRRRLRRKQRRYVELWKQAVIALNPTTLDKRRAVLRVEAVFGLLNSAHHVSSTFTDDELRTEIASTATAALTVP